MKFLKIGAKYLLVYAFLVLLFTLSLIVVCSLPGDSIQNNVKKSLSLLEKEGDYPKIGAEKESSMLDNFSESVMLNIIYNIDNTKPLESALRDAAYSKLKVGYSENLRVLSLKALIENNEQPNIQYPRYWHGYILVIRPLLVLTTYSDIRKIFQIAFFLLFSLIILLLYKRISLAASLAFTVSLALINFSVVQLSIQFSIAFFIAFVFMIILLTFPNMSPEKVTLSFFIVGALTSFMELLTAPLVTFGLPAITLYLLRKQEPLKTSLRSDIRFLASISFSWVLGYASLWMTKWLLASLILKENIIENSIREVISRMGEIPPGLDIDRRTLVFGAIIRNIKILYGNSVFISRFFLIWVFGLFLIFFIRWHKKKSDLALSLDLLIIGLAPYVWFIFAANHSYIHYWFTYRIQIVTIMAFLCAFYYAIEWQRLAFDLSNLRKKLKNSVMR